MGATLLVGGCALCFEINVPKGERECRCSTKMGRGSEGKDQNVTYFNIYTRKLRKAYTISDSRKGIGAEVALHFYSPQAEC